MEVIRGMRKRFSHIRAINKTNLAKLPESPGVYGIYTQNSGLLKVGRAKLHRVDERILENAMEIARAKKFSFVPTETVKEAIKLETSLIRTRKPPLNIERKGK